LIDQNRRALVRGKAQFLEMSYEDIYAPVLTPTQRREPLFRALPQNLWVIRRLCASLGGLRRQPPKPPGSPWKGSKGPAEAGRL